jgi:ubiquinone/menaquinone biosynthesis C-methylase UbiE
MSELTKRMLGMAENNFFDSPSPRPLVDNTSSETPLPPDSSLLGLYDSLLSGWFQNETGELFRGIPIRTEDVVLDAGCGEGGVLAFCGRLGAHVIAVDMHEGTLDVARECLTKTSARKMEFYCSSADALPVPDATASRIICTEVLEHVDDPAAVLQELVRVGQPGALYLFSVPDPLGESLLKKVGPASYFQAPNHIRIFEREAFAKAITDSGLELVSHTMTGFFWSIWWALYWSCKPDLAHPYHPILDHWTLAWRALLDTEGGIDFKHKLDEFMPKSQIIVARKR